MVEFVGGQLIFVGGSVVFVAEGVGLVGDTTALLLSGSVALEVWGMFRACISL